MGSVALTDIPAPNGTRPVPVQWGPEALVAAPIRDAPPGPRRPRRARRIITTSAALVASILLTLGLLADVHVRAELRASQSSLASTRSRLAHTLNALELTESALTSTASDRDALRLALELATSDLSSANASLATADDNLASTQHSLANANTGLMLQGSALVALNRCLTGVEQALNQIAVGNQIGAVHSISAVAGSCQSAQGGGTGGPVYPFDFPDPDVIRVGDSYYGYATNSASGNVQMIESSDLVNWEVLGDALPHLASWARAGATWAPAVLQRNGTFVLYYTTAVASNGRSCISVAVAAQPQGPFVDSSGAPLVCQVNLAGSIDASPFVDTRGIPYLTWRSQGGADPPTIWVQQLDDSGTGLVGPGPTPLIRPTQPWEGGVVEGPAMAVVSGHYYLFYSANNWNSANYAIGVALCQGPTGPCTKPLDHAVVATQGSISGPGGPTLFTDPSGGLMLAFHAWESSAVGYPNSRLLFVRQVVFAYGIPVAEASP